MSEVRRGREWGLWALLALLLLASLVPAACGGQPATPSGSADITGTVKAATPGDDRLTTRAFLVEGSGTYDKAQVAVTDQTAWYERRGSSVTALKGVPVAEPFVGKRVEVQFAGAVAESYPVQAGAGWVIVDE